MEQRAAGHHDGVMPGQDGHRSSTAVTAVSVGVAVTLLAAVGVAALRSDTASAATVLREAAGAQLVLEDGRRRAAVAGERVPAGATVELPGPGQAVLVTRDREVHLAQASSVRVVDGARQDLRSGTAFVDAADAPGLELTVDAGTVTVRRGALVRVDTGLLPRVGVLRRQGRGPGAEVRAAGRRTAALVPAYHQVQVPRGGLPGTVTALRLTEGDAYERLLAADLVAADGYLNATGDTLATSAAQGAVVQAALRTDVPGVPADRESGIGYLVATAADGGVAARFPQVRALRDEGGSWGPVAAIVGASVAEVGARLDALLGPAAVALADGEDPLDLTADLGLGGSGPAAGGPAAGSAATDPAGPAGSRAPGGANRDGGDDGDDDGGPTRPPPPPPSPSPLLPSPLPPPPDPLRAVDEVVDTVLELVADPPLPAVSPSPSPSPTPLLPLDAPDLPRLP